MESLVVRTRDLVALGFFTESDWLWRREQQEVVEGGEISLPCTWIASLCCNH